MLVCVCVCVSLNVIFIYIYKICFVCFLLFFLCGSCVELVFVLLKKSQGETAATTIYHKTACLIIVCFGS